MKRSFGNWIVLGLGITAFIFFILLSTGLINLAHSADFGQPQRSSQNFVMRDLLYRQSDVPRLMLADAGDSVTRSECIPTPWVLTDPVTREKSGNVLDVIYTPGDDKGAGTCMYLVQFPSQENPQWMITFCESERAKRQANK